jgi:hypothetical protein
MEDGVGEIYFLVREHLSSDVYRGDILTYDRRLLRDYKFFMFEQPEPGLYEITEEEFLCAVLSR